jgi:hypothetical protein
MNIIFKFPSIRILQALIYDWYAMKPNHIKPFFIRAIDTCASLSIELPKVDVMVRIQQSSWTTNAGHHIITTLCALPKGAGTKRIRAEMRQVIEDEGLSDYESTILMDH